MEYCSGGDLLQRIRQQKTTQFFLDDVGLDDLQLFLQFYFTVSFPFLKFVSLKYLLFFQILRWFAQMCAATQHIHDKRVLHRDLKSKVQ